MCVNVYVYVCDIFDRLLLKLLSLSTSSIRKVCLYRKKHYCDHYIWGFLKATLFPLPWNYTHTSNYVIINTQNHQLWFQHNKHNKQSSQNGGFLSQHWSIIIFFIKSFSHVMNEVSSSTFFSSSVQLLYFPIFKFSFIILSQSIFVKLVYCRHQIEAFSYQDN